MNKKNIDRILTTIEGVTHIITIIVILIYTVVTIWAGNVYNEMKHAVEKNTSVYEEVVSTNEGIIRATEKNLKYTRK